MGERPSVRAASRSGRCLRPWSRPSSSGWGGGGAPPPAPPASARGGAHLRPIVRHRAHRAHRAHRTLLWV